MHGYSNEPTIGNYRLLKGQIINKIDFNIFIFNITKIMSFTAVRVITGLTAGSIMLYAGKKYHNTKITYETRENTGFSMRTQTYEKPRNCWYFTKTSEVYTMDE